VRAPLREKMNVDDSNYGARTIDTRPRRRPNKVSGVGEGVGVFGFVLQLNFVTVLLFIL
jgi:hypothetical protein